MSALDDKLNELARECAGLLRREAIEVIDGEPTGKIVLQLNTRQAHEETRRYINRAIALAVQESGAVEALQAAKEALSEYVDGDVENPIALADAQNGCYEPIANLRALIANGERGQNQ